MFDNCRQEFSNTFRCDLYAGNRILFVMDGIIYQFEGAAPADQLLTYVNELIH